MARTCIVDTETDGLHNYKYLWCAVVIDADNPKDIQTFSYDQPDYLSKFRACLETYDHYVGHNFLVFDRYVIQKFTGLWIPVDKITDTLIQSRLYNPIRDGGHSLERWAAMFGRKKVANEDWSAFSPVMVQRCLEDTKINYFLYRKMLEDGRSFSRFSLVLEHKLVEILGRVKERGFPLKYEEAAIEYQAIHNEMRRLEDSVRTVFKPSVRLVDEVVPKYTKQGEIAKNMKGYKIVIGRDAEVIGPFSLIKYEDFNLGSPQQIIERLDKYGWKPVTFTKPSDTHPQGQPKITEENLNTLPPDAPEEAQLITKYLKQRNRYNLIGSWIDNYNKDTGRIHGTIIHIGTVSHRAAHRDPNTGNITKGPHRKFWGYPETSERRIAGVDAKGIQLRVLAHLTSSFTKDRSFQTAVLQGDPHVDFTLPIVASVAPELVAYHDDGTRKAAKEKTKRFIYAWLLGAGAKKVGIIFGTDAETGRQISAAFAAMFPGLAELRAYLKECSARGWYPCCDGRMIPIKSEHFALSVALQGIEQAVMKLAMVLWYQERDRRGWDCDIIAWVHDECQFDGHKDIIVEAAGYFASCITRAGEIYKLKCPMEGDKPAVGFSWYETH